ncbi:MAG: LuxR C-terminal-related transcriptional regulator, partial [Chloroflexota bacterium]
RRKSPSGAAEEIPLTQREIEILILLANGATNREMAQKLVVTEGTIKNHVSNILKSLNLRDRTQAAVYAVRQGLA